MNTKMLRKDTISLNPFWRIILFILCCLILSACSSKPTIYVYGKYLSENQVTQLTHKLAAENYAVKINDLDFPTSISHNAILYSLLLKNPETIDKVADIAEQMDMSIKQVSALMEGNHWYTKNSLAVFLLPTKLNNLGELLKQDLVHLYKTHACKATIELALFRDGSYLFTGEGINTEYAADFEGRWLYRQYPYIELKSIGKNYSGQYFEISQHMEQDQIGPITIIQLSPISSHIMPNECVLRYGIRR